MSLASDFTFVSIADGDRSSQLLTADWFRTNNAVGRIDLLLRNTDGQFNDTFDAQDTIIFNITDRFGANRTMFQGWVSNVELLAIDLESTWDEYVRVQGVDRAQDLMFHNDFSKTYADQNTQIKDVLGDLFDPPGAIDTNIIYNTPVGDTPVIGAIQFRDGGSFMGTYQEAIKRAGWTSYVNDTRFLFAGAPGFSATGVTVTNTGANRNIIGNVAVAKRNGSKMYNFIKFKSKNPMFDGYTEQNASSWTTLPGTTLEDSSTNRMVGTYSQRCFNANPAGAFLRHTLTAPIFNYDTWNLTKGEVGMWAYYDNQAASGGAAPGAGTAANTLKINCRLVDTNGLFVDYYGATSQLFIGDWGWITFPLGERVNKSTISTENQWSFPFGGADFDWENVVELQIQAPRITLDGFPSNFNIDGISLPFSAVSISEDVVAQGIYRRRPLSLTMPRFSTQNVLDVNTAQVLEQSKDSDIDYLKLMVDGNLSLQYAAESVTVDIPELGINDGIFYINDMHHVMSPRGDVTGGYAFDYVTNLELIKIGGVAYDMSRLDVGRGMFSATNLAQFNGVGETLK